MSRAGLGWAICRAVQPLLHRGELEALVAGFAGCLGGKLLFFPAAPWQKPLVLRMLQVAAAGDL